MTGLDVNEAMQIISRDLAADVLALDDLRVQASRDCDWHALARLRDVVRRAKADLVDVDKSMEDELARLMPSRQCEINGLGVIIRHAGGEWAGWDDQATGEAVAGKAIEAKPSTDDPFTAAAVAVAAVLEASSVEWTIKALRSLNLDPAVFATRVDTRITVQLPKLDRTAP